MTTLEARYELVCVPESDDPLILEAMIRIRAILNRTVARGMAELGEYLLVTFYEGDPALFRSSNPRKHASLRKLQDKCGSIDLPVSFSTLARALRIAVLMRELPSDSAFRLLPPSHQAELLKLDVREQIDVLALRATQESYSVKRLRAAVQKVIPRHRSTRGRKPVPEVLKAVRRCLASLDGSFGREELEAMSEGQRAGARELLLVLGGRVNALSRLLHCGEGGRCPDNRVLCKSANQKP